MEENTKELTVDEKLDLMLVEMRRTNDRLSAVEARQMALEEKVEDRLKDTRPMWQAIHAKTDLLIEQMALVKADVADLKGEVADLKEGLARVEARQNAFEEKMEEKMDDLIDAIGVLSADVIEVRRVQKTLKKRVVTLEQGALERNAA